VWHDQYLLLGMFRSRVRLLNRPEGDPQRTPRYGGLGAQSNPAATAISGCCPSSGGGHRACRSSIMAAPAIAGRQRRQSTRSFRTLTMGLTGRHGAQHLRATCLPSPLAADDTLGKAGGMIKARAVPVPSDSVLVPLYVGTDLLDAFAVHLPAGASDDLEVLA